MVISNYINDTNHHAEIKRIIAYIHENGPVKDEHFEFLAYIKVYHPDIFKDYEKDLLFAMGLFYKVKDPDSILSNFYNTYAETIHEVTGKTFTPMQADAYTSIKNNKYFSFSAPTSSGKSFLFRSLIEETENDMVIVVPSRALISEYIIQLKKILKNDNDILILPFIEDVNRKHATRKIFVVTPERCEEVFKYKKVFKIDIFLFDESHISDYIRSMKFDSLVRRADRVFPDAKKIFTSPFVSNPEAQLIRHDFSNNSYSVNYDHKAVGKIYTLYSKEKEEFYNFSPFFNDKDLYPSVDIIKSILNKKGSILVFSSKKAIYDRRFLKDTGFDKYLELCPEIKDDRAISIIKKLEEYIGSSKGYSNDKKSIMIDMMKRGIVIHHGSMPLRARFLIEEFVNSNYARVCFATSTLLQGINMPFDAVYIHNFRFNGNENDKVLDLKNLIGRAGRTKALEYNSFDIGYVIINPSNQKTFASRMQKNVNISDKSSLDEEVENIKDEELKDIAEALKEDTFNDEFQLTEKQLDRLRSSEIEKDISFILTHLVNGSNIISGEGYLKLNHKIQEEIRNAFHRVYVAHLRRNELTDGETWILDNAIPILLWIIQGKSFSEIISYRFGYIARSKETSELKKKFGDIYAQKFKNREYVRPVMPASQLPNSSLKRVYNLFHNVKISKLEYDLLVYDTYDYIDKVISLSLAKPLTAAFDIYYKKTLDPRAQMMINYINYGTNDDKEIWMLKYGFSFDEILELYKYVKHIGPEEVSFKNIEDIPEELQESISRYIYD